MRGIVAGKRGPVKAVAAPTDGVVVLPALDADPPVVETLVLLLDPLVVDPLLPAGVLTDAGTAPS